MLLALIRFAALAVLIVLVYRLVRSIAGPTGRSLFPFGRGGGSDFKCRDCRHCGKLFDDGALCRYGNRETFKNPTHISNCMDYEKRR